MTLANGLSVARLSLAPVLLVLALADQPSAFLAGLVVAFLLDLVDGPIARYLKQTSVAGARLDSLADFSIYAVFIFGAVSLWPEVVARERYYVAMVAASVFVPVAFGVFRFGRPTSLHTWMVKAAAVTMAPTALLLFAGFSAVPFRIATIVCVLAALEECLIIALLAAPESDVRSIFHVLRNRRR